MGQAYRRHFGDFEQFRGLDAAVTGYDLKIIVSQDWIAEPKLADRGGDLTNLSFGVSAGIAILRLKRSDPR